MRHLLSYTFYHSSRISTVFALVFALASADVVGSNLYRYTDNGGNTVLNRHIPPEAVPRGYEILNESGRVIDVIAPALSAAEIQQLEIEKEKTKAREEQAKVDQTLMQRYSHPNDAARMLARRVKEFERLFQIKRLQRKKAENIIVDTERQAADLQRSGKNVRPEIFETISSSERQIDVINREILLLKDELDEVVDEFEVTIRRLETLTGKSATDYQAIKERAAMFAEESLVATPSNPAS